MSTMHRSGDDLTPVEREVRDLEWVHTTMDNHVPGSEFVVVSHTCYCTTEMQDDLADLGLDIYEFDSHGANGYLRFHVT